MKPVGKSTGLVSCVLALLILNHASGRPAEQEIQWREFKSEKGGFSVLLPGDPILSEEPFERGPLKLKRYVHAVDLGDGMSLDLEYFDMPPGTRDAELVREGGMNGLTRPMIASGATVLTRGPVVRGTCQGLEATLSLQATSGDKAGFAQARVFSSGLRYYFLFFLSEHKGSETVRAMAGKFIESFSVNGGCTTAVPPVEAPSDPPKIEMLEGTIDKATGWRRLDRRELGFFVLMPSPIQHKTDEAQREPIPLMHHTFISEDDERVFTAEVIGDYPAKFYDTKSSLENLLDLTIWGLRKNVEKEGFVLTPMRALTVGDYPGREFSLNHQQLGLRGRAQVFATPTRAFVFMAVTSNKNPGSLDRFFSSIMISPN